LPLAVFRAAKNTGARAIVEQQPRSLHWVWQKTGMFRVTLGIDQVQFVLSDSTALAPPLLNNNRASNRDKLMGSLRLRSLLFSLHRELHRVGQGRRTFFGFKPRRS